MSAKEVPLLLNQGPEMTKALISCIGSSREWSFLDGHAQPHSLGFGEKRRMGLCVLRREEAPTASTPGVKRSGTVMVEM